MYVTLFSDSTYAWLFSRHRNIWTARTASLQRGSHNRAVMNRTQWYMLSTSFHRHDQRARSPSAYEIIKTSFVYGEEQLDREPYPFYPSSRAQPRASLPPRLDIFPSVQNGFQDPWQQPLRPYVAPFESGGVWRNDGLSYRGWVFVRSPFLVLYAPMPKYVKSDVCFHAPNVTSA